MQTDPVGYNGGINLYAYTEDDPTNRTDPTGDCPQCVGAAAGAAAGFLWEAADQAITGHFSGVDLAAATAGGAASGAVFVQTGGNVEAAGLAGGFVQNASKSLMEGQNISTAMKSGVRGGVAGLVAGNLGKHVTASAAGKFGQIAQKTVVGKQLANNEKFANMDMGRMKAGQISTKSVTGQTGVRMSAAAVWSSAASAHFQNPVDRFFKYLGFK